MVVGDNCQNLNHNPLGSGSSSGGPLHIKLPYPFLLSLRQPGTELSHDVPNPARVPI